MKSPTWTTSTPISSPALSCAPRKCMLHTQGSTSTPTMLSSSKFNLPPLAEGADAAVGWRDQLQHLVAAQREVRIQLTAVGSKCISRARARCLRPWRNAEHTSPL
eukprot:14820376-Alexandrium_andersonii.AAC.2